MRVSGVVWVVAGLSGLGLVGPGQARDRLVLREGWRLQSSAQVAETGESLSRREYAPSGWYRARVPTTVLAALVEAGVFPDPYFGDNITKIPGYREGRWLVMPKDSPFRVSWWWRCEFELPQEYAHRHLTLHLDGINYRANVWLNGRRLADAGHVKGMFRRFEFDITDAAACGATNVLAIETVPPGQLPDVPYPTKQLEATTGWDDHNPYPPDMNMGIWRDVYVTASGPVVLRHPYVGVDLAVPSLESARLTVSAHVTNRSAEPVSSEVTGRIEGAEFSQRVDLGPGQTRTVTFRPEEYPALNLRNPRVWWPHPVGPQEMYALELAVRVGGRTSDGDTVRFGVRQATTYINEEGWRGYRINGRDILIRGGAWMNCDMLLRLTPGRYDALIRYAREANLNMLRLEGFTIRETDEFYDLCDRHGVMVAQQLFGRNIPDADLALACVEDSILRIRNHPSLVHWIGHDETFPAPRLDRAYRDLIARLTPDRTYQPNSGAFDVRDRFRTGGTRTGTRELWTYATPGHYYTHKEDGAWGFAQSGGIGGVIAPIESMRRMMPAEALWPPWTPTWSLHTVIQGGRYFNAMRRALAARYGEPRAIEEFCRKGQALNYESARGMFEAYARNKYAATGITAWKFNAAWPASPTWQYVDWYLIPGGAYYGAKKACEPLHVQYSYDDHSVWVVNSFYRGFDRLRVTARVHDLAWRELWARTAEVSVAPDGKTQVMIVEWPKGLSRSHFLRLELFGADGGRITDNLYWLSTVPDVDGKAEEAGDDFIYAPKSLADHTDLNELPRVTLKASWRVEEVSGQMVGRAVLENETRHPAFLVHLAVTKGQRGPEVWPAYWDENYFTVPPGERREVRVRFASEDLHGAVPGLSVDGWNVEPASLPFLSPF